MSDVVEEKPFYPAWHVFIRILEMQYNDAQDKLDRHIWQTSQSIRERLIPPPPKIFYGPPIPRAEIEGVIFDWYPDGIEVEGRGYETEESFWDWEDVDELIDWLTRMRPKVKK